MPLALAFDLELFLGPISVAYSGRILDSMQSAMLLAYVHYMKINANLARKIDLLQNF